MSLPKHIKVEDPVHRIYGIAYDKDRGMPIYADMNGGWTSEELRLIADDIEQRIAARKK